MEMWSSRQEEGRTQEDFVGGGGGGSICSEIWWMSRSYQKGKNGRAYSGWRQCHSICVGQRQNNPWCIQEFQPRMHVVEKVTGHLDRCKIGLHSSTTRKLLRTLNWEVMGWYS